MIRVDNLQKSFGEKVAVNIPEFTIHDGDILGVVGNNGAGKTTLFRLMLDLMKADTGTVSINGVNPAESEEWKQSTGAYIDEGFLIDFLTPEEYFEFLGKVNNMTRDAVECREKDFEQFMSGEILNQKKIGIIAALLNRPRLVILDEPFNFLDPSSQNILKKLLLTYAQENGATILISSHNLQHTTEISTRIALLEHGVILKDLQNGSGDAERELEEYFRI